MSYSACVPCSRLFAGRSAREMFGRAYQRRILPTVSSLLMSVIFAVLVIDLPQTYQRPKRDNTPKIAPVSILPKLAAPAALILPAPPEPAFFEETTTSKPKVDKKGQLRAAGSRQKITPLVASTAKTTAPPPPLPPLKAGPAPQKSRKPSDPGFERGRVARRPADAEVSPDVIAAGRALLRVLEHGKGPAIEIAWPGNESERERLFRLLSQCHGMRLALMTGDGRLFTATGRAEAPWQPNLDRYSGFLRFPSGRQTTIEQDAIELLRRRHGSAVRGANSVRIFPRSVDASMLGQVQSLVGPDYAAASQITAAYRMRGGRVIIGGLRGDGRAIDGGIALPKEAGC